MRWREQHTDWWDLKQFWNVQRFWWKAKYLYKQDKKSTHTQITCQENLKTMTVVKSSNLKKQKLNLSGCNCQQHMLRTPGVEHHLINTIYAVKRGNGCILLLGAVFCQRNWETVHKNGWPINRHFKAIKKNYFSFNISQ